MERAKLIKNVLFLMDMYCGACHFDKWPWILDTVIRSSHANRIGLFRMRGETDRRR